MVKNVLVRRSGEANFGEAKIRRIFGIDNVFCRQSACGSDHLVMGKLSESVHYGQLLVMTNKRNGTKTST